MKLAFRHKEQNIQYVAQEGLQYFSCTPAPVLFQFMRSSLLEAENCMRRAETIASHSTAVLGPRLKGELRAAPRRGSSTVGFRQPPPPPANSGRPAGKRHCHGSARRRTATA